MTPEQAFRAIEARIRGEWDRPELVAFGAIYTDIQDLIKRIVFTYKDTPIPTEEEMQEYYNHTSSSVFDDLDIDDAHYNA